MTRTLRRFIRGTWYTFFRNHPYTYPGRVLIWLLPRSYLEKYYMEFLSAKSPNLIAKFIRSEIGRQYFSNSDQETRKINREMFWGGKAGRIRHLAKTRLDNIEGRRDELEQSYLPLVTQLRELLSHNPGYRTLCEIGTGTGNFLQHLSGQLDQIDRFIGVDLNSEQIIENRETYGGVGIQFVEGEIADWINSESCKGTVFLSKGTFEYFTQLELEELFGLIRHKAAPAAIVLKEPVMFDLATEVSSRPRGGISFSHNYPLLLSKCGFDLFRQETSPINPDVDFYNNITLIATTSRVE